MKNEISFLGRPARVDLGFNPFESCATTLDAPKRWWNYRRVGVEEFMGTGMTFYKELHLDQPYFIAAWTGMRNVALKAANFLREELQAEEFAEIERYPRRIREEIQ